MTRNDILVVTTSDEPNVQLVSRFLPPERVYRLDYDLFLEEAKVTFSVSQESVEWEIRDGKSIIRIGDLKAVWFRRPAGLSASPDLPEQYREFVENETKKSLRSLWSVSRNSVFWMNHPEVEYSLGYNKPLQSRVAAGVGLAIPETLITNEFEEAKRFWDKYEGEVIIKTFGGAPMRDAEGNLLAVYTSRVTRELLEGFGSEIGHVPVMLQNYIPKKFELRVTIVGKRVFSCAIHSQSSDRTKDDWRRYDFENVKHEESTLPEEVERKLLLFMRKTNLSFGAIDMIVTPKGEYVFIEINPSGQWQWIEALTGMPISQTIAEALLNPPAT